MSARSDRETDEAYYHDDIDEERPAEARDGRSAIPYFPAAPLGWWPFSRNRADEGAEYDEHEGYDDRKRAEEASSGGIWRFWDESLITLLIVGGAILFLFPEPATSGLGVLLMGLGVIAWAIDWAT